MTHLSTSLTLRVTAADLANLALVANHLRASGDTFANRTTAIRYALKRAAEASQALPAVASLAVVVADKVTTEERHEMTIHFDGGAVPNPGQAPASIAVVGGEKHMRQLGAGTCNLAEWQALLWGLAFALERGATDVTMVGDSALIINQANGAWKIRAAEFLPLKAEFDRLRPLFRSVRVTQVGRAKNLAGQHIEAALKAR